MPPTINIGGALPLCPPSGASPGYANKSDERRKKEEKKKKKKKKEEKHYFPFRRAIAIRPNSCIGPETLYLIATRD